MAITKATASSIAPAAKGDIVIGSATNDAGVLAVGTNGYVLTAASGETLGVKWAGFSGASIYLTSNTTNTSGSTNLIDFTSEFYDTDNYHSNDTNPSRLTVPKAGKYILTMSAYWSTNNSNGYRDMSYYINNVYKATVTMGAPGGNGATTLTASYILDLAANDYVTMKLYQNSGSTLTIQADGATTGMSIGYLGA